MVSWLARLLRSFRHAFSGIGLALRSQRNVQIHLAATVLAVAAGFGRGLATWQWCMLVICIALVWMAELFNTALEKLCDRLTLEEDESIRHVKDIAAGAVLITAIAALLIAWMIFV